MKTATMIRINELSVERANLYRQASNGHRGDPEVRQRAAQIGHEIEVLWEERREERAGHREGIDLLVERSYERAYGSGFDDVVAPPTVATVEDEAATVAA